MSEHNGQEPREFRIVAATGCLGYGFSTDDFRRVLSESRPHAIAVDAGSTDPGPYYLGAGQSFAQEVEVRSELEIIIAAGLEYEIPVIIGTAGGAGGRPHVEWTRDIVTSLAREHSWSFQLGLIQAEVSREYLLEKIEAGDVHPFESGESLDAETVAGTVRVVAQMGAEPIVEALRQGAEVILCGRACDDAVFAALPILNGFERGLALHMGKVLECGALASVPLAMDVMVGTIRDDHFDLVPGSTARRCTVASVAGHSLYERENPVLQAGPGGTVDLGKSVIEQVDERTVRVSGTTYEPAAEYMLKLEGVSRLGTRAICVAGVRDPVMIETIDDVLAEAKRRTENYFDSVGVSRDAYQMLFHAYGRDAVMQGLEPRRSTSAHELGLVMEVVADDAPLAKAVCQRVSGLLLHLDFPGQFNTAGNLAMLMSPAVVEAGEVYGFSVYHLLRVADPLEPFEIEVIAIDNGNVVTDALIGAR